MVGQKRRMNFAQLYISTRFVQHQVFYENPYEVSLHRASLEILFHLT